MRYLLIAILPFVLSSCVTQSDSEFTEEDIADYEKAVAEYEKYSSMETPASWGTGKKWILIYVRDDEIVNRLIVEPTSESVKSWVSGDWKKLSVLFEEEPMEFKHFSNIISAYEVNGKLLSIMMAANITHTKSVEGRFEEDSFVGSVETNNPYCFDPRGCKHEPVKVYGVPLL